MLQNFFVSSSKTVDTLNNKRIAVFQFAYQFPILRPFKILAGLLVNKNCTAFDSEGGECN